MKAISLEEVEVGDNLLFYFPDDRSFKEISVDEVDLDDRSVVCVEEGLNWYPNEDEQYIIINYEGEE